MEYTEDFTFARPYISPGETILWRGKPGRGNLFTSQDVFMIPFSIFWCGFAFFWEITAISGGAPFLFALFGAPFICVGLYLVFGRFLWTAYIRKRTAYVITNRKIIRARGNKIDMLDGKTMPPVYVTATRDGSGTIQFGQPNYYRRRRWDAFDQNAGLFSLENVPDVARVQQMIESMER